MPPEGFNNRAVGLDLRASTGKSACVGGPQHRLDRTGRKKISSRASASTTNPLDWPMPADVSPRRLRPSTKKIPRP